MADQNKKTRTGLRSKETPPLKSMTQEDLSYWNKRLTDLNKMQQESDDIQFKINDEQIQLYADWYKYMITEYNLRLGPITRENRVNDIRHYLGKQMEHLTAQFFRLEQLEMDIELQVEELNNGFESWNNKVDTPRWQYKLLKNQQLVFGSLPNRPFCFMEIILNIPHDTTRRNPPRVPSFIGRIFVR